MVIRHTHRPYVEMNLPLEFQKGPFQDHQFIIKGVILALMFQRYILIKIQFHKPVYSYKIYHMFKIKQINITLNVVST